MTQYGSEFLGIVLIHFLAVISPGPDFAVAIRQSVRHGRRVGIWTALGIGAGISVHVLYTLVGISALLRTTPWAMSAARWAGAAYLLWLRAQHASDAAGCGRAGAGTGKCGRGCFRGDDAGSRVGPDA